MARPAPQPSARSVRVIALALLVLAARLLGPASMPAWAASPEPFQLVICSTDAHGQPAKPDAPVPGHAHHGAACAACPLVAMAPPPATVAVTLPTCAVATEATAPRPPGTGPPPLPRRADHPTGPPAPFA